MRSTLLVAFVFASVGAVVAQEPVSVDDTDPSIQYYSPNGDWTKHVNQDSALQLWGNSDTFTSAKGATITWSFKGTAIEYWGNTGSYHGPCQVTVDGKSYGQVSSNAASTGPPIQIFKLAGLDPAAQHTIVITVVADAFPNVCELDRFIYTPPPTTTSDPYSNTNSGTPTSSSHGNTGKPTGSSLLPTTSSGTNTQPTTPVGTGSKQNDNNNPSATSKSSPPWGAIGGAVGGALAILLAGLLLWYCRRRKNRKDLEDTVNAHEQPSLPVVAMSEDASPFPRRPTHPKVAPGPVNRPPSTSYAAGFPVGPPTSNYASSAVSSEGQFARAQSLVVPASYADMSSRQTSTYGSEASYGAPTSPAFSTHSQRPLLLHNPTTPEVPVFPQPATQPLVHQPPAQFIPPAPQQFVQQPVQQVAHQPVVMSAATEVGQVETFAPDAKRPFVLAAPEASAAGASTATGSGPSAAAAPGSPRPVVQHQDAGIAVPAAAADTEPVELPPAYNLGWQGGPR